MKSKVKKPKVPEVKCLICGKPVLREAIAEHLKECRGKFPLRPGTKDIEVFRIAVIAPAFLEFFLCIEIAGTKKLSELDAMLRDAWLECCGHLSLFRIGEQSFSVSPDPNFGDKDMGAKIGDVLKEGMVVEYDYDMGSTTALELEVLEVKKSKGKNAPRSIVVAQNEPPEWKCCKCANLATRVSTADYGIGYDTVYCDACAKTEFESGYEHSPIVNSPRSSTCGYGRTENDDEAAEAEIAAKAKADGKKRKFVIEQREGGIPHGRWVYE